MSDNVVAFPTKRASPWARTAIVQIDWNLSRTRALVFIIDPANQRGEVLDSFADHASAAKAAMAAAAEHDLRIYDNVAVDAGGVWNLRPVATAVNIVPWGNAYAVGVLPAVVSWVAYGGSIGDYAAAEARAHEISRDLNFLPVVLRPAPDDGSSAA